MFDLIELNGAEASGYVSMTFPSFRPLLSGAGPAGQVIAIGACRRWQPVGLALARMLPDGNSEVLSIFVAAAHRGRGVGTALVARLERALSERGCLRAQSIYMTGKPTTAALENLLRRADWSLPQSRMFVCRGDRRIFDAPWMKEYALPPSFNIFPWREITRVELAGIRRTQELERWVPEHLLPFQDEAHMELSNSLGLRYRGQVVGWLITHRIATDTVRFTSLFVRRELQKTGRAIPLVVEAINRQARALGYDSYVVMSVRQDNAPMVRFLKRRIAPYLASLSETRGTDKLLGKDARRQLHTGHAA